MKLLRFASALGRMDGRGSAVALYSLTVWTGQNDKLMVQDLMPYKEKFDISRIYYDLPDPLWTELSTTLHDNN